MKFALVVALLAGCRASPDAPEPEPTCPSGIFSGSGEATWTVVKNGTSLVTGRQSIDAKAAVNGPIVEVEIEIDGTPRSGIELRDMRIWQLVFAGEPITFKGQVESPLPAAGSTLSVEVGGDLGVGGLNSVGIAVPTLVDWIDDKTLGVRGTLSLDMRGQLGLGPRLSQMLSLVDASVEDKADVAFDLKLRGCQ